MEQEKRSGVQEYYGERLTDNRDLQTNACCVPSGGKQRPPAPIREALSLIHDEVRSKFYGCGLTVPADVELLRGLRVLDLGSGSGQDCFILSKLVGAEGHVVGVDMTYNQVKVAKQHVEYHTKAFGYDKPNVEFKLGFIEKLDELGFGDESFDLIISNCVINLCPDKRAVLREAHRLLKPGGELYFSDVYADRRVPEPLQKDPVLWGECLSGALYRNDFLWMARGVGFGDPRLVEDRVLSLGNTRLEEKLGHIKFFSSTYRLFKLDDLEPACEDYGQAVIYKGTIQSCSNEFVLDQNHVFAKGKVVPVCGNTCSMLAKTRLAPHFTVIGDRSTHFGLFVGCGSGTVAQPSSSSSASSSSAPSVAAGSSSCC